MAVPTQGFLAATWPTPRRPFNGIGPTSWVRHPPGKCTSEPEASRDTASRNANFAQPNP